MVSGFVTSPEDQSRICFDDARPIRIASKSLISIKSLPRPLSQHCSVFDFQIGYGLTEWSDLSVGFLLGFLLVGDLDVLEISERLVGRQRQLGAGLVGPLLALFLFLCGRLATDGAERAGREVDPELLRRAEQLVLLLPHLDLAALVREDVDVE